MAAILEQIKQFNFKLDKEEFNSLIFWQDIKKSAICFTAGFFFLLALRVFSIISIFSYAFLFLLVATISFRIYAKVNQVIQQTSDENPFSDFLNSDVQISEERSQQFTGFLVTSVNAFITELRRLVFVENFLDSLKFALLLWLLTYIGAKVDGLGLITIGFVGTFVVPLVYENNKVVIDDYIKKAKESVANVTSRIPVPKPAEKQE
jgi:hypothetical protein